MIELDHLAMSASNLEAGQNMVETALGVALQPGGQHVHYGTHNLLLGLEDGLYLEVIAIDPEAPKPGYPRWFDLDQFTGPPRLTHWICRTDDLAAQVAALPGAGRAVSLARGDLRWQMAVPDSGVLPFDNCFPPLIQWETPDHPAKRLAPSKCRLDRLIVSHPDARSLDQQLTGQMNDVRVHYLRGPAGLRAEFSTPHGPRVLA